MRIAILTYLYSEAVSYLYNLFPNLDEQNYDEQKIIIDKHVSIWASGWENEFEKNQIPILTVPTNIPKFLKKWAKENNFSTADRAQIILEMVKRFSPDILFYDLYDYDLLEEIKAKISSIKLVALWKGSPPIDTKIYKLVDVTISCAPEEVSQLNNAGIKAEHLHHAFNKNILDDQKPTEKLYNVAFIGQIFKSVGFHINRDKVLKNLVNELNLNVFSEAYNLSAVDFTTHFAKKIVLAFLLPFYIAANKVTGGFAAQLEKSVNYPLTPYSVELKKSLKTPVYGKKMYDTILKSKVVLNIHADSSPLYASNMRLFETTGIGSCLLTDWNENINELFEVDKEVVTFRNVHECIEKAKWLLANEKERSDIAIAGQKRVFSSHLYEHRLPQLLNIFKKHLK